MEGKPRYQAPGQPITGVDANRATPHVRNPEAEGLVPVAKTERTAGERGTVLGVTTNDGGAHSA